MAEVNGCAWSTDVKPAFLQRLFSHLFKFLSSKLHTALKLRWEILSFCLRKQAHLIIRRHPSSLRESGLQGEIPRNGPEQINTCSGVPLLLLHQTFNVALANETMSGRRDVLPFQRSKNERHLAPTDDALHISFTQCTRSQSKEAINCEEQSSTLAETHSRFREPPRFTSTCRLEMVCGYVCNHAVNSAIIFMRFAAPVTW
jgi:hypothetical protein